jgi:hypothetical protein
VAKINTTVKLADIQEQIKVSGVKQPSQETVELRDMISKLKVGRANGFAYELDETDNANKIKARIAGAAKFLDRWIHAESVEDGSTFWVWLDPRPRQTRKKSEEES